MKKRKAFTLAEVLITLVIIGVIAALTVPTLIQNTQKREYVSALKKVYSTLSQVTQQIITEEGSPKSSCETCNDGWAYSADNIYTLYKKYLSSSKECNFSSGCWYNAWDNNNELPKLILADGTLLMFHFLSKDCSKDITGSDDVCAAIWIDVNGNKKPNKFGRDLFNFVIKESGFYPRGCDSDSCSGSSADSTGGCACKVLTEGAMNY